MRILYPSQMVHLIDVWLAPYEQVTRALAVVKYPPTTPQYDRALLAMIYYNTRDLDSTDNWAVTHPNFLATLASALDLNTGLRRLLDPFSIRFIILRGYFSGVSGEIADLATSDYWLYKDHIEDLSGLHAYPWGMFDIELLRELSAYPDVGEAIGDLHTALYERQGELDLPTKGPPGATRAQEIRMTELIWSYFLSHDVQYRTKIIAWSTDDDKPNPSSNMLDIVYNPYRIIDIYLNVNMKYVHPLVRCLYWYSIWELNEIFPRPAVTERILSELSQTCGKLSITEVPNEFLLPGLIADLVPLAQAYMGPPSRKTFIARLIAQFENGLQFDTSLARDLNIFDRILSQQGLSIDGGNWDEDQANYVAYYLQGSGRWTKIPHSSRGSIAIDVKDKDRVKVYDVYGRDRTEEFLPSQ